MGIKIYALKECDKCGVAEIVLETYLTYNYANVWFLVFPDAKDMLPIEGLSREDVLDMVSTAQMALYTQPQEYAHALPTDHWGSILDLTLKLDSLCEVIRDNPQDLRLEVSR